MTLFSRISLRSMWMVVSLLLCASAAHGGRVTGDCFGWELNGNFGYPATIEMTVTLKRQDESDNFVPFETSFASCDNNGGGSFVCSNTWSTELPEGTYRIVTTEIVLNLNNNNVTTFHPKFGPFDCLGPICDIIVFKEGCVVPSPPDTNACDGKVTQLTLRYTGEDCDATMHTQNPDKVNCEGDPASAAPVRLLVTDNSGDKVFADVSSVLLDGEVVVAASNAGEDKLPSSTFVTIFDADDNVLQSIEFHTSCSQPLAPGNQFGSIFIAGMITTNGGEVVFEEEDDDICITDFLLSSGEECDGKVVTLSLKYTGGNCTQTSHSQDPNKVSCSGDAGTIQPVRILVTDKNGDRVYADVDNVPLNGIVLASAANAGQGKLKSSTRVRIFDSVSGLLLQEVEFHTSCSQPLKLGDQYGAIQIFGMETTKGGNSSLGAEVIYTYTVHNGSTVALTDVEVFDDVFGEVPGSPIPVIGPGETIILTLEAIVTETTFNTVFVTGTSSATTCLAEATSLITAIEPPPGAEDCCESGNKLQQIAVTYTGEGCEATMHSQKRKKVRCEGDPAGADAHIRATDKKNPNDTGGKIWFEGDVIVGEQFIIDAMNAGKSKLKGNTYVHIFDSSSGDLLQTLKFHTSCSQPLFVGDQFGSIVIDGCTPEGGPLEGQFCVGGAKPSILTMSYTGAGCGATEHSQNPDKVSCEGDADNTPLVRIRASDKEDPEATDARVWFDGLVVLDETFDIAAANAGKSKLKSKTWVHIFLGDTLLETIMFHTSCSQPLNQDDQFGSLTLVEFIAE